MTSSVTCGQGPNQTTLPWCSLHKSTCLLDAQAFFLNCKIQHPKASEGTSAIPSDANAPLSTHDNTTGWKGSHMPGAPHPCPLSCSYPCCFLGKMVHPLKSSPREPATPNHTPPLHQPATWRLGVPGPGRNCWARLCMEGPWQGVTFLVFKGPGFPQP